MKVSSRMLEDGDIMNIDITVYVDGYHGDTSRTFLVGTGVVSHPFFSTPESNSSPVSLV
jgi:methionine aminopeptidase